MCNVPRKYGLSVVVLFLFIFIITVVVVKIEAIAVKQNISIFCYHRVVSKPVSKYDLTPAQLEAHLQFFKSQGYQPITVTQFLRYQKKPALFPEKPVILTFDDGTKSHYTEVLPLLKKYDFKATFYIFPNATRGSKKRWLGWDEIAEIARAGMDIGSHALSHPYLTARDEMDEPQYQEWLERELVQSKKILEEHLKIQVKTLAYPFGLYDRIVETAAVKAGYVGLLNINVGLNSRRANPLRLKRRIVVNTMGPKSLANIMAENVLEIEKFVPGDGAIVTTLPKIRFRVKTPGITLLRLEVSKYLTGLKPDAAGVYSFTIPGKLKPGFYNVIIRGKDFNNRSYLSSWAFNFRPGEIKYKEEK
jgi:peptidoglycan/xylan/chitin deacetylase (PgdA/CDA1 family)